MTEMELGRKEEGTREMLEEADSRVNSDESDQGNIRPAPDLPGAEGGENQTKRSQKPLSAEQVRFLKGISCGFLIGAAVTALVFGLFWFFSKEQVIRRYIRNEAITKATEADIDEGKYDGMAAALGDRYAAYYTKDETKANKEKKSGTYEGIGVVISQEAEGGAIVVVGVYPGSSAEEAGIAAGDILKKIGETDMAGLTTENAVSLISEAGKTVTLTLEREGKPYEVTVERRKITVPKVTSFVKDRPGGQTVGYIGIESFIYTTADQFAEAMDEMDKAGIKGLIIDLRGNTGGLVDAAVNCLDRLLPKGLVVYTQAKDGTREDHYSKGTDQIKVPVVLLVDAKTASAAEIFAGALRDRIGAPFVGTVTYGKGIVQLTQFLADGSSFKYTSAQYYTPNGTSINGTGFEPDYPVELNGGGVLATSEDDNQYQKAMEVLEELMKE